MEKAALIMKSLGIRPSVLELDGIAGVVRRALNMSLALKMCHVTVVS